MDLCGTWCKETKMNKTQIEPTYDEPISKSPYIKPFPTPKCGPPIVGKTGLRWYMDEHFYCELCVYLFECIL